MQKLNRRHFLRGVAFGAGALALAACGQAAPVAPTAAPAAEPTATPAPTAAPAAEPTVAAPTAMPADAMGSTIEITYWGSFSGGLGEAEQATVDAFNSSQQDVKVNYQFQGSYEETAQKLTAAIQAGQAPDVSLMSDVWWFSFYVNNQLLPLNDLMAAEGIKTDDYQDVLIKEGTRKEQVFWVPFARSTPLFYYNADMWAAAGLPERGPETWAEFGEWAPRLNSESVSAFAHPGAASYIAWLFQGVIWQHGGEYSSPDFTMTIDSENGIRAGNFYRDTTQTFKWATTPQDVTQDFVNGLSASAMMSTGALAGVLKNAKFKVGTAFLPKADAFGCPTGGAGMGILASSTPEKQQAAMKWIAFATSDDWAAEWSIRTGYMPVRKKSVESEKMQAFFQENPNFKTAVDQLPLTRPQDAARVYVRGGDQIIGKGLERIVIGGEEVAPVWADVKAELEETAKPTIELFKKIEA
ncbi:MAG: ABC transporter substrate-binding protein [Roseiflexaceae bacterium]